MEQGNTNGRGGSPRGDAIEVWGRRIGRALGWAAVVFLLVQLVRAYAP